MLYEAHFLLKTPPNTV